MKSVLVLFAVLLTLPTFSQSTYKIKAVWKEAQEKADAGEYEVAIQKFEEALNMCDRAEGWKKIVDRKDLANPESDLNYINLYIDILGEYVLFAYDYGTYSVTERRFDELLQILYKSYGEEWPYGSALKEYSDFYFKYNQLDKASELLQKAEPIFIATHSKESPEYGELLMSKADLSFAREDYDTALDQLLEAERLLVEAYGKNSIDYAYILISIGDYLHEMGNFKMAKKEFTKADKLFVKFYGETDSSRGMVLQRLANVEAALDNLEGAIAITKQALAIAGKNDDACLGCEIYNLGLYQFLNKDYQEAYANLKSANDLAIKLYRLDAENMTVAERSSFIEEYDYRWNLFYQLLSANHGGISGLNEAAFELSLNIKGMILDQTLRVKSAILSSKDEWLRSDYERWIGLKQQLASLYASRDLNEAQIKAVEKQAQELEKKLLQQSQDFKKLTRNSVDWEQIRDGLKAGEAAIEIMRVDEIDSVSYLALIVKPDINKPILVKFPKGDQMESSYFKKYQNLIKFKLPDNDSYKVYWEPLAEHLTDIQKVFLSPDGVYHNISLAGLFDASSGKYLIDKQDVQKVITTGEIIQPRENFYWNNRGYLIGYPTYNSDGEVSMEVKKLLDADTTQRFFSGNEIVELPGTFKEIESLESTLDSASLKATILSHHKATERNIKSLKSPRLLHIATHGYYLRPTDLQETDFMMGHNTDELKANPMLRSGLLLANAKDAISNGGDGLLTAFEVSNLNLTNTDLVVLSACETGLGDVKSGEGVFGLQRAFRIAGANAVIMSLWTVSDDATQAFMNIFYDNWLIQKMTRREAFLAAQKNLRERFPHPYYWAAFIMVGTESEPLPDVATTTVAKAEIDNGWSANNVMLKPDQQRLIVDEFVYGAPHAGRRFEIYDFEGNRKGQVYAPNLWDGWLIRVKDDQVMELRNYNRRGNEKLSVLDLDGNKLLALHDTTLRATRIMDIAPKHQMILGVDALDFTVVKVLNTNNLASVKQLRFEDIIEGLSFDQEQILAFTPYKTYRLDFDLNVISEAPRDDAHFRTAFMDQWLVDQEWTSTFTPPKVSRQVYDVIHSFDRGEYLDERADWTLTDNHIMLKRLNTIRVERIESTDSTYHLSQPLKSTGVVKSYKNGQVYKNINYRDGKYQRIVFFDHAKGQVAEVYKYWKDLVGRDFVNRRIYLSSYAPDGTRTSYDGNGVYKIYYPSGRLDTEFPILDGQIHGTRKSYHKNGQLSYQADFVNGMRQGKARWYYDNGQLEDEIEYKADPNNPLIGLRWTLHASFTRDGTPLDRGNLSEGNGSIFNYDDKGVRIKERVFENGKVVRERSLK